MTKQSIIFLLLFFTFVSLGASEKSSALTLLASANNKFVLPVLLKEFEKKNPNIKFIVEYGTSGELADSILNAKYYDVFLSANVDFAQKVYKRKKALDAPREYAKGVLVLFVPADTTLHQKELRVLESKKILSINIVNHESSPYGKASIEALQNAKLFDELEEKINYSKNLGTIMRDVIWYDNAAFLSKSAISTLPSAFNKEGVNWIEVNSSLYTPITQAYVVSKEAGKKESLVKFLDFLHSQEGQAIYKAHGYK